MWLIIIIILNLSIDLIILNPSFKYKANLIGNTEANKTQKGVKIAVPLKYLRNFWISLEMSLINCKVELSLAWIKECVLTTDEIGTDTNATGADSATYMITDTKLYVPVITLSTEASVELSKQLDNGSERPDWKYCSRYCCC